MKSRATWACACALLLSMNGALAGSRPLNVVFIDIGTVDVYAEKFFQSYVDGDLKSPEKSRHCWTELLEDGIRSDVFGMISGKKRPAGLDVRLARKIWQGDEPAAERARRILRQNFEYAPGKFVREGGYDGMYILDSDGRSLGIMSIGAHKGASERLKIAIDDAHPDQGAADFSYALCKVGAPLMNGFGV